MTDDWQVEMTKRVERLEAGHKRLIRAFPANDLEGHRRAHEAMMEDVRSRNALTQAIKEKTISGLVWSAMAALGFACWHEILYILGRVEK